jgi:hypothetical protein
MNHSKIKTVFTLALFAGVLAASAQITNIGNMTGNQGNYNPPIQQYQNANINLVQGNQFENNINIAESNPQVIDNNDNNPPQINQAPQQMQSPAAPSNQTIEPTLSNGFHIRFNLDEPSTSDKQTTSARTVSYKSSKSKGSAHNSFKVKRRFKHLFPHSKGKYKTSLCYNF